MNEINSDIGNVVKQDFTTLQLSTSLVLLIETKLMSTMNYDLAKKIGNAISAALFHKNPITINELQQIFTTHQNSINHLDEIQKLRAKIESIKVSHAENIKNLENNFEYQKQNEIAKLKLEIQKLQIENEFNCPNCNKIIKK